MAYLIDYTGVELSLQDRPILSAVTIRIGEGELVYVMGEVGSGKTSLLRSIYGEMPVSNGIATVLDTDMTRVKPRKLPKLRKQLGIVFQDFKLLQDRTVDENLDFVLRATGWKKKIEREERIIDVLETVELPDKTRHMPYELSGGEQQRICIARAMLNMPKLILADEPTANLDAENARKVMELLTTICQHGTTVVMTTHNEQLPLQYPGRILRCAEGRVTEEFIKQEEI